MKIQFTVQCLCCHKVSDFTLEVETLKDFEDMPDGCSECDNLVQVTKLEKVGE